MTLPMLGVGFNDAFVGYDFHSCVAIYDYAKCLYNVAGSWVGEHTPVFLRRSDLE